MSLTILRNPEQSPLEPLLGKTVAVIGFGNQGHAHALNLRESGVNVLVGSRPDSPGSSRARESDFSAVSIQDASGRADLAILALPDEVQPQVYEQLVAPNLKPGATLGFLHGFNIRFGFIKPRPDIGVIMVAPKGPGRTLRERLDEAVAAEKYELAAQLRDELARREAG